jgi:DinB superfamily
MTTASDPPLLPADTKAWTFVLERPCVECGFDPAAYGRGQLAPRIRSCATQWQTVLAAPSEAFHERPNPSTWSPIEYACHVRDVLDLFRARAARMVDEDEPRFTNWDQDVAAVAGRYHEQGAGAVATAIVANAHAVGALLDRLPDDAWDRHGTRSDGTDFTVESLTRYMLHDVLHHLVDVGGGHDTGPPPA